jgi:hypothetical protein
MSAAKNVDGAVAASLMSATQQLMDRVGIAATEPPQAKDLDIVEYEGRMKVSGMEKFEAPCYISVINFYLSTADMERHKPKGALVLYVEFEHASKLFNSLGFRVPDDEDDVSMMSSCGAFCTQLAEDFKKELLAAGYSDLVLSKPQNAKNKMMTGAEFSADQNRKHEISFFYWKHKALVVELTMAALPKK